MLIVHLLSGLLVNPTLASFLLSLSEDEGLELVILDSSAVVLVDDLEEWVDIFSLDGDLELGNEVGNLIDGQVTALVQVEVIKDLLEELWVLAGQLKDARFDLTEQVLNSLLSDS